MSYDENSEPRDAVVWTDWKPLPYCVTPAQRLWIISNVHGRRGDLHRLLRLKDLSDFMHRRPYTDLLPGTRLVSLGNMIDYGRASFPLMRDLQDFAHENEITFAGRSLYNGVERPECTLLWGEHEAYAYACIYPEVCRQNLSLRECLARWEALGGRATLNSVFAHTSYDGYFCNWLELRPYLQKKLSPYFSALQRYFLSQDVLLCPAGTPSGAWFDFFTPLLPLGRENSWLNYRLTHPMERYSFGLSDPEHSGRKLFTIFGHTPVKLTEAQAKYALAVNLDAPLMALIELEPAAGDNPDPYHPEIPNEDKNRAYYRYRLTGTYSDDPDAITPAAAAALLNAQTVSDK